MVVELVAGNLDPDRLGDDELAAPHLLDSEVLQALRGLVRRREMTDAQATIALAGFTALTIRRFAADWLRSRIWELRHNLTAYDATYVALAELSGAEALLTTDARLAQAPGVRCPVRLL